MSPLEVGAHAPDFALRDQHGRTVTLSSYRGEKAVLLVFYPWAFTRVCEGELRTLAEELPRLPEHTVLLAVSCDTMHTLRAFSEADRLTFPLLSDHWPHGAVASAYGVFDESTGAARRSSFVIDREGVVRWSVHHGYADARRLDDYLQALHALG